MVVYEVSDMSDGKKQQFKIRPVWLAVLGVVGAFLLIFVVYNILRLQSKGDNDEASVSINDIKVDHIGEIIDNGSSDRVRATVEVQLSDCAVTVGTVFKAVAIVTPANTEQGLVWSSNNTGIFEVGQDGVVTVKGIGTAVLTATVGNVSDSVVIEGISQVTDGSSNNLPIYNVAKNEVVGGANINGSGGSLGSAGNAAGNNGSGSSGSSGNSGSAGNNGSGSSSGSAGSNGNVSGDNTGSNSGASGNGSGSANGSGSIGGNTGNSGSTGSNGGSSGSSSGVNGGGSSGNSGINGGTSSGSSGGSTGASGNSGSSSGTGSGNNGGSSSTGSNGGSSGGSSGSTSSGGSGENTGDKGIDSTQIGDYLPDCGFDNKGEAAGNVYVCKDGGTYQGQIVTLPNVTIIYIKQRNEGFDEKVKEVLAKLLPKEHGQVWNNYVTASSDRTFTVEDRMVRIVLAANGGHSQIVIYN